MNFSLFEGEYTLSGCELKINAGTKKILFILDGDYWLEVVEDKDDGERSYCGNINFTNEKPEYEFNPTKVMCKITNTLEETSFEICSKQTGQIILKFGTDYTDKYYPVCRFSYYPENIY